MKLLYNGKQIYELSEIQKKVIKNDIPSDLFDDDMTRRCKYIIVHPCDKYAKQNSSKFKEDLKGKGKLSVPLDYVKLAALHAQEFPCKYGYSNIKDVTCTVGDQSFVFSAEYQKINRKMNEKKQDTMPESQYLNEESQELQNTISWILKHKYERCLDRLKREWLPKLELSGFTEIPSSDDSLCELIFSQKDYKNRSVRDEEFRKKDLENLRTA